MKKIYSIIIFLIAFNLASCESLNSKKNGLETSKPNTNKITNNKSQKAKYKTYLNSRYRFSIEYPADWKTGEESDNGDGKILYIGNPDIDIRVYASNYLEDISDPYHNNDSNEYQLQYIKLNDGKEATLILDKQEGKVLYEMVYISKENIEYHFLAKVSEEFFKENEKILLKMAKSMKT